VGIAERLEQVHDRIVSAARSVDRDPSEIRLIAVTKKVSADRIRTAILAGVREIGENRVQEAQEKRALMGTRYRFEGLVPGTDVKLRWHLIGPLQRNKVKAAAELFDAVHSPIPPRSSRRWRNRWPRGKPFDAPFILSLCRRMNGLLRVIGSWRFGCR